jgi:hypothetical protein
MRDSREPGEQVISIWVSGQQGTRRRIGYRISNVQQGMSSVEVRGLARLSAFGVNCDEEGELIST